MKLINMLITPVIIACRYYMRNTLSLDFAPCDFARLAATRVKGLLKITKILLTRAPLLGSNIAEAANRPVSTGFPFQAELN